MAILRWKATYTDGTEIIQVPDKTKYDSIDRKKLKFFDLIDETGKALYRVHMDDPRKRLIWRIRHAMISGGKEIWLTLMGWQMTVGKENIQSLMYIMEKDGRIMLSGGWEEPFGKPELFEFEKVN